MFIAVRIEPAPIAREERLVTRPYDAGVSPFYVGPHLTNQRRFN